MVPQTGPMSAQQTAGLSVSDMPHPAGMDVPEQCVAIVIHEADVNDVSLIRTKTSVKHQQLLLCAVTAQIDTD